MENNLAFFREQRGMTQEELAAYVGLPAETIKAAEEAPFPLIAPSYVVMIADVLGEDANDIFPSMPKISDKIIREARQKTTKHVNCSSAEIELEEEETKSDSCSGCEATEKLDEIAGDLSGIMATFKIVLEAMEREADDYSKLTNDSHMKERAAQYTESLWHIAGQLDIMYNGI